MKNSLKDDQNSRSRKRKEKNSRATDLVRQNGKLQGQTNRHTHWWVLDRTHWGKQAPFPLRFSSKLYCTTWFSGSYCMNIHFKRTPRIFLSYKMQNKILKGENYYLSFFFFSRESKLSENGSPGGDFIFGIWLIYKSGFVEKNGPDVGDCLTLRAGSEPT